MVLSNLQCYFLRFYFIKHIFHRLILLFYYLKHCYNKIDEKVNLTVKPDASNLLYLPYCTYNKRSYKLASYWFLCETYIFYFIQCKIFMTIFLSAIISKNHIPQKISSLLYILKFKINDSMYIERFVKWHISQWNISLE